MSPEPRTPFRALAAVVAVSALLGGCTGAPAPPPAAAASGTPAGSGSGGGRHGGGTTPAAVAWPPGVPLPSGRIQQISAAQGVWMSTVLVADGLVAACGSAAAAYRAAGWDGPSVAGNAATEPVVLTSPGYEVTIVCTAADHSPSATLVTVHLSAK